MIHFMPSTLWKYYIVADQVNCGKTLGRAEPLSDRVKFFSSCRAPWQLNLKGKHDGQTGNGSQETTNKQTWMERIQIRTSL